MTLAALAVSLPYLLAGLSCLFTAVHTADELVSEDETIWEYLADVYRWFPRLEFAAGFVLLMAFAVTQAWLAVAGYALGGHAALWALPAVRLADFAASHWLPWLAGRRPNPGLMSSPLYAIDAAFAGMVLAGGLY